MIKFLRRAVILLFVFVLGVAGSSFLLNSETTDDRSDMNDPVFPEVMVDFDGNYANRMYGYAQPMQSDFTRDSVTPISFLHKFVTVSQSLFITGMCVKVQSHIIDCETDLINTV